MVWGEELDEEVLLKARKLRLVVFDVDGVLTNGSLYIGEQGEEYKAFHSRDGHGMKMLKKTGVELAVITGRSSPVVQNRMASLGIQHVYHGQKEKLPAFESLLAKLELTAEQAAFVGDDVIDLPAMARAGLAIAVSDAHPIVAQYADCLTPHGGGQGAARDVCDLIMLAQGNFEQAYQKYLK